mgnify:CR=1 FL=1
MTDVLVRCKVCGKMVPEERVNTIGIEKRGVMGPPLVTDFAVCDRCFKVFVAVWKKASKGTLDVDKLLSEEEGDG